MSDVKAGRTMKYGLPLVIVLLLAVALVSALVPGFDLAASALFYRAGTGFFLANHPLLTFIHYIAIRGAWVLGEIFIILCVLSFFRRKPIMHVPAKGWLFLLLALLIGPVLIANLGFKDHWGRARPREIVEFGGNEHFSPALEPQEDGDGNASFISGDGAFGFFLPSFAYVVPPNNKRTVRRIFWLGMALGMVFGLTRLAMGAHFLSDNTIAALLMLLISAGLYAAMFGVSALRRFWHDMTASSVTSL